MKKVLAILVFVAIGLVVGVVSADSPVISDTVYASFYDGNPDEGASELTKVSLLTGSVSKQIVGIEDAEYVVIEVGGQSYTYEICACGDRRDYIMLITEDNDLHDADEACLSDVLSDILK